MDNQTYLVYKHIFPNNKIYIGLTRTDSKVRWKNGNGYKTQKRMFRAIQKYGWKNVEHIIVVDNLTEKEAFWLEKYLILYYESTNPEKGYNSIVDSGTYYRDDNHRQIMSSKLMNHYVLDETKKKMSESHKGITRTDETKEKMSKSQKGRIISEEHKQKISESLKGRSSSFKGKQHNEDSRNKIRNSKIGKHRVWNEEHTKFHYE